jgi:hypothetical protein
MEAPGFFTGEVIQNAATETDSSGTDTQTIACVFRLEPSVAVVYLFPLSFIRLYRQIARHAQFAFEGTSSPLIVDLHEYTIELFFFFRAIAQGEATPTIVRNLISTPLVNPKE